MRKIKLKNPQLFKRLNAPYRMVFINEDSLEEVGSFHLTKGSVYTLLSMLFIVIIAVTLMILLFTPLRYYIPGYGSRKDRVEILRMKQKVDSLSDMVSASQKQAANIQAIISGRDSTVLDTTVLTEKQIQDAQIESIIPQGTDVRQLAGTGPKAAPPKKRIIKKPVPLPGTTPPTPGDAPLPAPTVKPAGAKPAPATHPTATPPAPNPNPPPAPKP